MLLRAFFLLLLVLFLGNCAHHRDVRPGPNGVNTVVIQADRKDSAYRDAHDQADHYCQQYAKAPVVLKEKNRYKGTMSEGDYNKGKSAAKASVVAGDVGMMAGDNLAWGVAPALTLGGLGGSAILGDSYNLRMRFRCVNNRGGR